MVDAETPTLTLIVPTWKTGRFAEELCTRAIIAAERLGIAVEIVFVVDACPEGSAETVRQVAATWAPVRLIELPVNVGQDAAIREGLRACRSAYALILDGDLQDPPEALTELWSHRAAFDAVFADRRGAYEGVGRRLTSRAYRWSIQMAGGLPRGASLFALLDRRLIEAVARTHQHRISVLAAIAAAGGNFTSVPIERERRCAGVSGYTSRMRWNKALHSIAQTIAARYLGIPL